MQADLVLSEEEAITPRMPRCCIIAGCLLLLTLRGLSQTDSVRSSADSASIRPIFRPDSIPLSTSPAELRSSRPAKSPWLAVGFSAVAPGAGQIYNTNYWKAPLIWGLGGYWIYEWIKLNNKYKDLRDQYNQSLVSDPPIGNPRYLSNRDFYRDERDKFAWYLGALYFLNLVDAYVGAHLYDFDVTPDLGVDGRVEPKLTATLRWNF